MYWIKFFEIKLAGRYLVVPECEGRGDALL